MHYQLIALDIDGTLLNSREELTPSVHASIHRAHRYGWLIALVTGRPPRKIRTLAHTLGITSPLVAFNGAIITDPITLKPLQARHLASHIANPILGAWERARLPFFAYRNTTTSPDVYYSQTPVWPHALSYVTAEGEHMLQLESVVNQSWEPLRLMVMDEEATAREAQRLATPHILEGSTRTYFSRHYDDSWYFEVYPLTSKADGIDFLCSHYGIAPEQVVAVGDNVNDVDMLTRAGLGVAMGNATPEAKKAAGLVIGHHDDDGLAHFLDQLITDEAVQ